MEINPMVLTSITTSFLTSLAAKGITGPAETLNDIWKATLGYPVHFWAEKRKLKYEADLKKFETELTNKILEIPKEQIQEPKISILGPALEASKYYFEEDEIREMFSNLIASSMDKTYNDIIQHSFVEIIKQLSPYDAKFLSKIENCIQTYGLKRENTIFQRIFCITPDFLNFEKNSIAITNLNRLGLLDQLSYFELNDFPQKEFINNNISSIIDLKEKTDFSMQPHAYVLSPLGIEFKKICIKNSL